MKVLKSLLALALIFSGIGSLAKANVGVVDPGTASPQSEGNELVLPDGSIEKIVSLDAMKLLDQTTEVSIEDQNVFWGFVENFKIVKPSTLQDIMSGKEKGDTETREIVSTGGLYLSASPEETVKLKIPKKSDFVVAKIELMDAAKETAVYTVLEDGTDEFVFNDFNIPGEPIDVVSTPVTTEPSVYYWDRWPATSGERNNGQTWWAGGADEPTDYSGRLDVNSDKGAENEFDKYITSGNNFEGPGETVKGKGPFPSWPGTTDTKLVGYAKLPPFKAEDTIKYPGLTWVPFNFVNPNIKPLDEKVTDVGKVIPSYIRETDKGKIQAEQTDLNILGVSLTNQDPPRVKVTYRQTFKTDTNKNVWDNPGAKQIYEFAKFQTSLKSYTYNYSTRSLKVTYKKKTPGGGTPGNNPGGNNPPAFSGCVANPLENQSSDTLTIRDSARDLYTVYDTSNNPKAIIRSDSKGNETYNVDDAMPSGKNVYENITDARRYLVEYCYEDVQGTVTYSPTITNTGEIYHDAEGYYDKEGYWVETSSSYTESDYKTAKVEVSKNYRYKKLLGYVVYKLDEAIFGSPKQDKLKLLDIDQRWLKIVESASVSTDTSGGRFINYSYTTKHNPSGYAEAVSSSQATLNVTYSDDCLTVDGQLYEMGSSNLPTYIHDDQILKSGIQVPKVKINGMYEGQNSSLLYSYDQGSGMNPKDGGYTFFVKSNNVTILTPVVNYDTTTPGFGYDQRQNPSGNKSVVVGSTIQIDAGNTGQHQPYYRGYGWRDYSEFVGMRQARFEFPVSVGLNYYNAGEFVPLNITGPTTITVPEWVNEGVYGYEIQTWAYNDPSGGKGSPQLTANLDLTYHGANQFGQIEVVGAIFGFRVNDVSDLRFESVFRKSPGSMDHTGRRFYAGPTDVHGPATTGAGSYLPMMPGSISEQPALVAHNGYSFGFDFKTLGGYFGKNDGAQIIPKFKYVPKAGGTASSVDLYYSTSDNSQQLIRVGGPEDNFKRTIRLMDPRNSITVDGKYVTEEFEAKKISTDSNWESNWKQIVNDMAVRRTQVSNDYADLYLNYTMRRLEGFIDYNGGPSNSRPEDVAPGVQHWYGEFSLPVGVKALPAGTSIEQLSRAHGGYLTGQEAEFLRDGYIVVGFDIFVHRGDFNPVLRYNAPDANLWQAEGQQTSRSVNGKTFNFDYGDVMFFDLDFSAANEYH